MIDAITQEVAQFLTDNEAFRTVEHIQDKVERCLMEHGFYTEAKSYILYRWQRTEQRQIMQRLVDGMADDSLADTFKEIQRDFPDEAYNLKLLADKLSGFMKRDMNSDERLSAVIKVAIELTTQDAPDWEFIAARLYHFKLTKNWRHRPKCGAYARFTKNCNT